jgi:hypothetical protein
VQNALVAISAKALFDGMPHVVSVFSFILRFSLLKRNIVNRNVHMQWQRMREAQKITSRFNTYCNGGGGPLLEKVEAIIVDMYAWEKQYLWEQLSLIASI